MSASASPSTGALQLQLSEQLQALSLVSETLTLRLLDLEERLAALEGQLEGLQQQSNPSTTDSAELLSATEERIARLEELLNEPIAAKAASVNPLQQPQPEPNPFPKDEEQPFMDELNA